MVGPSARLGKRSRTIGVLRCGNSRVVPRAFRFTRLIEHTATASVMVKIIRRAARRSCGTHGRTRRQEERSGGFEMKAKLTALLAAILAVAAIASAQAAEPKHGGILKFYHRETPPSLSIHEEATFSVNIAGDGDVQQLDRIRSAQAAEQHGHHRAGSGDELVVGQGEHRAHLQAAAGRHLARRQAVHGRRT